MKRVGGHSRVIEFAALLAFASGCKPDDPTELVIVVTTNLTPGTALRQVTVTAEREGSTTPLVARSYVLAAPDGGAPAGIDAGTVYRIPGEVSFVAANPNDTRALHVVVAADLGGPVNDFTQEALVHFRAHELVYVEMFLPQRCGFPINRICDRGYICGANGCQPIDRTPESERPVPRDVPLVDAPLDDVLAVDVPIVDSPADIGVDATVDVPVDARADLASEMPADTGTDLGADVPPDVVCPPLPAPHLIGPTSGTIVSTGFALLEWTVPAGATYTSFDVCATRDCAAPTLSSNPGTMPASSGLPATGHAPMFLPPGTYYWRARGHTGVCDGRWSPVAEFVSPPLPSGADAAVRPNTYWGAIPDVNGDGFADLLIGTPSEPVGSGPGRVDLYLGSSRGINPSVPTLTLPPPADLSPSLARNFGASVSGAGDMNGDGYPDVVVGTHAGMAYIYLGSAGRLDATAPIALSATIGGTTYTGFGAPVLGVGDVDHDGYADIAVGASDARVVVVFHGAAALTASALRPQVLAVADGVHAYGTSIAAGDFDGDRYTDLIVGGPGAVGIEAGRVYVSMGTRTGSGPPTVLAATGAPVAAKLFGVAMAAGDLNGDGYADIVVGEPGNARVQLFRGGPRGIGYIGVSTNGVGCATCFGAVVASAGDLDGDTFADFLVGTPSASLAFVLFGTASTTTRPELTPFPTGPAGAFTGSSLAGAGDFDNDGLSDAVVGAASYTDASQSAVTVYRTRNVAEWRGTVTIAPSVIVGPMPRNGSFGRALGLGR